MSEQITWTHVFVAVDDIGSGTIWGKGATAEEARAAAKKLLKKQFGGNDPRVSATYEKLSIMSLVE